MKLTKTTIIEGRAEVTFYGPAKTALNTARLVCAEVKTNAIGRPDLQERATAAGDAIARLLQAIDGAAMRMDETTEVPG